MADITVTTLADTVNAGDGVTSLREALALANGNAESDNITFAAGLAGGTLFLITGQQLEITGTGTTTIDGDINGDDTPDITIDADSAALANDAASRVFRISNGGFDPSTITATLNGLVIQDGHTIEGAGIWVGPGDVLTLTNSTVSGNTADSDGGGIFADGSDAITLANVTVSGNSSVLLAGGIFVLGDVTLTLTNATVSGNSAGSSGGGVFALGGVYGTGSITLTNSTVTGNRATANGGGIADNSIGIGTTLTNSIVAGNDAGGTGDDLFGSSPPSDLTFVGGNIVGSAPVGFTTVTGAYILIDGTNQAALETVFADVANDPNTGVLSSVLADNGGPGQTVAIASSGIARDAGDNGDLPADPHDLDRDGNTAEQTPVDARGLPRVFGTDVDIGAFEAGSLQVTTLDDEAAATDNLAAELADGNGLSLREALAIANGDPADANTITFASALAGGTLFLTQAQHLQIATDGITVDGDIDGDGTADITIDADTAPLANDATSRVFLIDGGVTAISAALNGLVIRDGNVVGGGGGILLGTDDTLVLTNAAVLDSIATTEGGAIRADDGATITLINVTLSGNTASGGGGGMYADNDSVATLMNSTVSGNRDTGQDGGGLYADTGGTLTLINSTVWGNSTAGDGGGIYGFLDTVITLINSTVTGNSAADSGGGIYNDGNDGITTLTNSIVAGNRAGTASHDLYGGTLSDLTFTGNNIIGSAPVGFVTVTGAPTHQIDGTSQADLETVFADVALVDPDGAGGNAPFLAGVLADNGGPVQTVAIQFLGLAHNGGDNGVLPADTNDLDHDGNVTEPLPVDARGLPRTIGPVDIGAFEVLGLPPSDFNADLHSDILWRDDAGTVALWEMDGVAVLSNTGIATIPTYWHIADADSDFDGDGASDILWQDDGGVVVLWTMDGAGVLSNTIVAGPLAEQGAIAFYWHIQDTGDFTGDGRADILWRDDAGRVVLWEMDGATIVNNTLVADVATTSHIEGVGDFTGDAMADILWRDDDGTVRLWEMDGPTVVSDTTVTSVPDDWHVVGLGDFNGDVMSDVLWRDGAGTVTLWEMDGATIVTETALGTLPDYWQVADVGDYTGDANHDILWRDDTGTIVLWEMNGPTIVDNTAVNTIPTNWQIIG
jgi:parallel beta-helix repeat protein